MLLDDDKSREDEAEASKQRIVNALEKSKSEYPSYISNTYMIQSRLVKTQEQVFAGWFYSGGWQLLP